VDEDDRKPLPFIASVDCAALPRVDGLGLPEHGVLLFFLEHEYSSDACSIDDEQQYARVVYVPAGTRTVAVEELPAGHDEWSLTFETPFERARRDLYATVQPELPGWLEDDDNLDAANDFVQGLARGLTHTEELKGLVDELWPEQQHHFNPYLGGYSMELGVGDNPESHLAAAAVKAAHPDWSWSEQYAAEQVETQRLMREWVPLAQFETADDVYYGRFLIRHEDLAARRFDKVLSFTMFTE
jgi:uncharacterized protein YwqG